MARHRDDVALLGVLKVPMASLRSRLFPAMLFGNRITSRTFIGMTPYSTGPCSARAVSRGPVAALACARGSAVLVAKLCVRKKRSMERQ